MKTWQLNIKGIVQGVGLRPRIFLIAIKQNFKVHVYNDGIGVKVFFNAIDESAATSIVNLIVNDLPSKAKVNEYNIFEKKDGFVILENKIFKEQSQINTSMITPDMSWCKDCKVEYEDTLNKRFGFLFIACSNCGPRYSLWQNMPFERENTTMKEYEMCQACIMEYYDFEFNRRAFSQLNTCQECSFKSYITNQQQTNPKQQIYKLSQHIKSGEIVAVKGIAGFLIVLDYTNVLAIQRLRNLKKRRSKPFAIMAINMAWIKENFNVKDEEEQALKSLAAPIVLLSHKEIFKDKIHYELLCGVSKHVGVMLPSSAFLYELCKQCNGAIIATSGNISGLPIAYENENAKKNLQAYTKHLWYYDRKIIFPQDDSVISFSPHFKHQIIHRRARGLSPSILDLPKYHFSETLLALGAELKNTFCLAYNSQILLSQYLGNMHNIENLERLECMINNILELTQVKPTIVIIDQHPNFNYRNILYNNKSLKVCNVFAVQHHIAHLAAVMGENNCFGTDDKILGIVFDGIGYSLDGKILGGEFFIVKNNEILHHEQMPFFKYLMKDKMSIEPRLCYYSLVQGKISSIFEPIFSIFEKQNFSKILPQQIDTNSIGRVFDAFSFCIGFTHATQSYEGEASTFLMPFFEQGLQHLGIEFNEHYMDSENINWQNVFTKITIDLQNKIPKFTIAFKFLLSILKQILYKANQHKVSCIAVSGGVFQNGVLIDILKYHCTKNKLRFITNKNMSSNDENISFGQIMAYTHFKNTKYIHRLICA